MFDSGESGIIFIIRAAIPGMVVFRGEGLKRFGIRRILIMRNEDFVEGNMYFDTMHSRNIGSRVFVNEDLYSTIFGRVIPFEIDSEGNKAYYLDEKYLLKREDIVQ